MYVPTVFAVDDRSRLVEFIERHPFGILVSHVGGELFAAHVPFIVLERAERLTLALHVAKANPLAREAAHGKALAIFRGPHAMISAGWYEHPEASVPTWNYSAVHCSGTVHLANEKEMLAILERTVELFEPAWRMQHADANYIAGMVRGITAMRIEVTHVDAKFKYSQNRSEQDRRRVVAALEHSARPEDREVAAAMREMLS